MPGILSGCDQFFRYSGRRSRITKVSNLVRLLFKKNNIVSIHVWTIFKVITRGCVYPRFIQKIASDLLLPRRAGKTSKNAGIRLIYPACRTRRVLLAMYRVLTGRHLSWYTKHLVPHPEEDRDPASRKVQGMPSRSVSGPGGNLR
jgi:hypothetical protein